MATVTAAVVSVVFTGLSMFDLRDKSKVDVLVMQRPQAAMSDYYEEAFIPKHVAFVRFRCVDTATNCKLTADPTLRQPNLTFFRQDPFMGSAQDELYGLIVLDRETVQFQFAGEDLDELSGRELESSSKKAKVPSIKTACKKCGDLLEPDAPAVGGVVTFSNGALSIDSGQDFGPSWCIRGDKPKGPACSGVLPQEVRLDFKGLHQAKTKLVFKDSDGFERTLELANQTATLDLMIGSAPLDDLLHMGNVHEQVDHHFEVYYDMFAKVPNHPPIPHLVRMGPSLMQQKNAVESLFIHGGNCPPVKIE